VSDYQAREGRRRAPAGTPPLPTMMETEFVPLRTEIDGMASHGRSSIGSWCTEVCRSGGLTVYEPDDGAVLSEDGDPSPFRSAVPAPAREDDGAGRRVAADTIARSGAGRD
jgi:hypothetical protein